MRSGLDLQQRSWKSRPTLKLESGNVLKETNFSVELYKSDEWHTGNMSLGYEALPRKPGLECPYYHH